MNPVSPFLGRRTALLVAAALLAGCASTVNSLKDAEQLVAEQEAAKSLPASNLSDYARSLSCFGQMLDVYKDGDPVIYMQTRSILDATNLSSPFVGAEIPGDITEMVRTAVNRIGARIVYVPFHPDYLISQAQLGAKFGVTMPDYLITGALTEFDRALGGAGRSNSGSLDFGKGRGETSIGADMKRTTILSALALDLNLVNFSNQQMVPRVQASNAIRVLNVSSEDNASLGFYGASFGFKAEGKYLQGRHSAIRTLVDLSVLELVGKATNTPYWRCIPNGQPDPIVIDNMRLAFDALSPEVKIGLTQVTLRKYGESVEVTQTLDEATQQALRKVIGSRPSQAGESVDALNWSGFNWLFFNIPVVGLPMPVALAAGAKASASDPPPATPVPEAPNRGSSASPTPVDRSMAVNEGVWAPVPIKRMAAVKGGV